MRRRREITDEVKETVRRWYGYGWTKSVINRLAQRRFDVYLLPREMDAILGKIKKEDPLK